MINQSKVTMGSLNHVAGFSEWWEMKSAVKGFNEISKRINVPFIYETFEIKKNAVVDDYSIIYYTNGKGFKVEVSEINMPELYFNYNC